MIQLTEEQLEMQKMFRRFAKQEIKPRLKELDELPKGEIPWEIIRKASEIGLMTGYLPKRYGGTLGGIPSCILMEEISAIDSGVACLIANVGLGITPVALSGDREMMDRFFPNLVEAEQKSNPMFWAFAITEPDAGSDVEDLRGSRTAKLMTFAKRDGDHYVIRGRKCFVTAGNVSKWTTVFACLDKEKGVDAWACFIVDNDSQGFSVGTIEDKMGQKAAPAVELILDDVHVPKENLVGKETDGWRLNLQSLAVSRPSVGAIGVGIARGAFEEALEYATKRYQGGKPIVEHQAIQMMLADMVIQIEAARLLCYQAVGQRPISLKLSSAAKVFGTDASVKVATDAIQVMGGYGYMKDYSAWRYYRDAKITQIYEGTNQINRIALMEDVMEKIGYSYAANRPW